MPRLSRDEIDLGVEDEDQDQIFVEKMKKQIPPKMKNVIDRSEDAKEQKDLN